MTLTNPNPGDRVNVKWLDPLRKPLRNVPIENIHKGYSQLIVSVRGEDGVLCMAYGDELEPADAK